MSINGMDIWGKIDANFSKEEIQQAGKELERCPGYPQACPFGGWGLVLWQILWERRHDEGN